MCFTKVPQYMVPTLLSDRVGLSTNRGSNELRDGSGRDGVTRMKSGVMELMSEQ